MLVGMENVPKHIKQSLWSRIVTFVKPNHVYRRAFDRTFEAFANASCASKERIALVPVRIDNDRRKGHR